MSNCIDERLVAANVESGAPFNFDNCARNVALANMGMPVPKTIKTGTTIVAVTFKDGVVMGADSRATAGNIIADKNCVKVHRITDQIVACGAGTAADLHQVSRMLESQMTLHELNTGTKAHVISALRRAKQHLFRYQGHVGAYLLLGGIDATGPHLYTVAAHGSSQNLPYDADGSGSYHALSYLERGFKIDMTREEAIDLCSQALMAGMHGDLMSGNSYRLTVIQRDRPTEHREPVVPDFAKKPEMNDLKYDMKPGATKVLKQKVIKYDVIESMEVE